MTGAVADRDIPVEYNRRFREYGIKGGSAQLLIGFCPWCGHRLPESLRDAWFQRLDELGIEPGDPGLPEEMKSDAWWNSQ
jgi:hypothetical protein